MNNKKQLIKLQDKYILVSDEEIKEGDFAYCNHLSESIIQVKNKIKSDNDNSIILLQDDRGRTNEIWEKYSKKILSENPDFSELNEEDCKTIGWVDVEKLAISIVDRNTATLNQNTFDRYIMFVKEGIETAQSINDKMFSLGDIKAAFRNGWNDRETNKNEHPPYYHNDSSWGENGLSNYIQSLQQKSWDVEAEGNKIIKII